MKNGEFSSASAMFTFLAVYSRTVFQKGTLLTGFFLNVPDKSTLSFTSKCYVWLCATLLLTVFAPDMTAMQIYSEEIQAIDPNTQSV